MLGLERALARAQQPERAALPVASDEHRDAAVAIEPSAPVEHRRSAFTLRDRLKVAVVQMGLGAENLVQCRLELVIGRHVDGNAFAIRGHDC
jgi:hypothetical protein